MTAWIGDSPDDMRRVRPDAQALKRIPRRTRLVEVVCPEGGANQPRLIAVIYPRGAHLDNLRVMTTRGSVPLGVDVTAACRCADGRHTIPGDGLRRSAMDAATRSRPATLRVDEV